MASNIVWLITSLVALGATLWGIRRGIVRIRPGSAVLVILLVSFLLLPVISVSDDILEARQAALPPSGQTWHLAWEGASVGLELPSLTGACLLLLPLFAELVESSAALEWFDPRHIAAWLTRSQRLRPPPAVAH